MRSPNDRAFLTGHVPERQAVFRVSAPVASDRRKEREDGSLSRRSARDRLRSERQRNRRRNHRSLGRAVGALEPSPRRPRRDAAKRARLPPSSSSVGIQTTGSGSFAAIARSSVALGSALSRPRRSAPPPRSAALRALTAPARSVHTAI